MFSAAFRGQSWFLCSALVVCLVLACGAFFLARQRGARPWEFAGLTALVAAEVSVTLAMPNGGYPSRTCVIDRDVFAPLLTQEGLLNLLMFLPIGAVGVCATRSLVPVVAGCAALSMLTELTQAVVPGVGRDCDSGDFTMNVAGAIAGATVAYALLRKPGSAFPPERYWRPASYGFVAVTAVAAIVGATCVRFLSMDSTSIQFATGSQKDAARRAMKASFGDRYAITKVQFQPALGGGSGAGSLAMVIDGGKANASLTWPDNRVLTVSFEFSGAVTAESFPIAGVSTAPRTADDALEIATRYARRYHPDALRNSRGVAEKADPQAAPGWTVSWRRLDARGVLMPMRLDVGIDRAGRISQLVSADIADPADLPPIRITKAQAEKNARRSVAQLLRSGSRLKVTEIALRADHRRGTWRTEYVVSFAEPDGTLAQTASYVDATTGSTVSE